MKTDWSRLDYPKLLEATFETFYMAIISLIGITILGVLLGLLLFLTTSGGLKENKFIYAITATIVNVFRAIPFIILIILIFPLTQALVGTIRGPNAALPALILGAAPFYGRLVEIALKEIDKGVIEAAQSMGASLTTIIFKVLLKESLPALVSALTVTAIALIGYTAVAGAIGAGGLGGHAYYVGFQRRLYETVLVCSGLIIAIVFLFQFIGDYVSKKIDKR